MSDRGRPAAAVGASILFGLLAVAGAAGLVARIPEGRVLEVRLLGSSVARLTPRDLALAAMALGALAVLLVGIGIWIAAASRRRDVTDETSVRNAGLEANNLLLERRMRGLEAEIEQLERARGELQAETQALGHRRFSSQGAPRSKMPFPRTSTSGEAEPIVVVPDKDGGRVPPQSATPEPKETAQSKPTDPAAAPGVRARKPR